MNHLEKEILNRIKSDDEKAFELLFKTYYSPLCIYACDILNSEHLAEEVVQEVLIKLWETRNQLSISQSLKGYLYKSVHNQCINLSKHLKVLRNKNEMYSEFVRVETELWMIGGEEFTLDDYFYEGLEKDIQDAINDLPEQCSIVFKMSRFEMLSHETIALKLGVSVNTIKTQIRRALEKLRQILHEKVNKHLQNKNILNV